MRWKHGLFILLLLTSIIISCQTSNAAITVSASDVFQVDGENYTFNSALTFTTISYNYTGSWIRFNDINFNITSANPINITMYSLNGNMHNPYVHESMMRFGAFTSGGKVFFNISGFDSNERFTVYKDGYKHCYCMSNASGGISFSNTGWSAHNFEIIYDYGADTDTQYTDTVGHLMIPLLLFMIGILLFIKLAGGF